MKHIDLISTAKLIRETLKTAFPGVKFSVRSKSYSGGCSIDVHWADGPIEDQVNRMLSRFEGRGFDGMQDLSYYCGQRLYRGERVDFCGAYIHGSRRASPALMRTVAERVCKETGNAVPTIAESGYIADGHDTFVPFQWHSHWLDYQDTTDSRKPLTACDLLASGCLLASDSHGGEYLTRLIDKICAWVSLKPHALPVELPEYLPEAKEA